MIQDFKKFYTMEPMKYYQPQDYENPKAKAMIENAGNQYICTKKNDGEWGRFIVDEGGKVTIQSRTISKVTGEYGNKTELLPHLVEQLKLLPPQTVFLGEICYDDVSKTSKDVGAILRCLPAKAIARQSGNNPKLVVEAFDLLAFGGKDYSAAPFEVRFAALLDSGIDVLHHFSVTPYVMSDFEDFLQDILAHCGEGIVIHRKGYIYAPGKRPAWSTLKVKKIVQELELPVVGLIEPSRTYEGKDPENWNYWMGTYDNGEKVWIPHAPGNIDREAGLTWEPVTKPYYMDWKNGVIVDNHGTLVRVTSGLSDDDREWLASEEAAKAVENGELIATVTCMEIDKESGSLRHPRLVRLRTDA